MTAAAGNSSRFVGSSSNEDGPLFHPQADNGRRGGRSAKKNKKDKTPVLTFYLGGLSGRDKKSDAITWDRNRAVRIEATASWLPINCVWVTGETGNPNGIYRWMVSKSALKTALVHGADWGDEGPNFIHRMNTTLEGLWVPPTKQETPPPRSSINITFDMNAPSNARGILPYWALSKPPRMDAEYNGPKNLTIKLHCRWRKIQYAVREEDWKKKAMRLERETPNKIPKLYFKGTKYLKDSGFFQDSSTIPIGYCILDTGYVVGKKREPEYKVTSEFVTGKLAPDQTRAPLYETVFILTFRDPDEDDFVRDPDDWWSYDLVAQGKHPGGRVYAIELNSKSGKAFINKYVCLFSVIASKNQLVRPLVREGRPIVEKFARTFFTIVEGPDSNDYDDDDLGTTPVAPQLEPVTPPNDKDEEVVIQPTVVSICEPRVVGGTPPPTRPGSPASDLFDSEYHPPPAIRETPKLVEEQPKEIIQPRRTLTLDSFDCPWKYFICMPGGSGKSHLAASHGFDDIDQCSPKEPGRSARARALKGEISWEEADIIFLQSVDPSMATSNVLLCHHEKHARYIARDRRAKTISLKPNLKLHKRQMADDPHKSAKHKLMNSLSWYNSDGRCFSSWKQRDRLIKRWLLLKSPECRKTTVVETANVSDAPSVVAQDDGEWPEPEEKKKEKFQNLVTLVDGNLVAMDTTQMEAIAGAAAANMTSDSINDIQYAIRGSMRKAGFAGDASAETMEVLTERTLVARSKILVSRQAKTTQFAYYTSRRALEGHRLHGALWYSKLHRLRFELRYLRGRVEVAPTKKR